MAHDTEIYTFVAKALEDKIMDGSGFSYTVLSETLHIVMNRGENEINELIKNGLMFVVE